MSMPNPESTPPQPAPEPAAFTIVRSSKYALTMDQLTAFASEYYGGVHEVDPVGSHTPSGFDLGASPMDQHEVTVAFERESYRDQFLVDLGRTFGRRDIGS